MKSLREYLTESQKTYEFKVKVAGEIPENFAENLKVKLSKFGCAKFEQVSKSPIQTVALDFPEMKNVEVTIFEVACSYPVTPPQISNIIKDCCGLSETCFRVKNINDPTEEYTDPADNTETDKKALLNDPNYKEAEKVKSKDYFGDAFNKSFLKDLDKAAKDRKKSLGHKDVKGDAKDSGPDWGTGSKSPIGS